MAGAVCGAGSKPSGLPDAQKVRVFAFAAAVKPASKSAAETSLAVHILVDLLRDSLTTAWQSTRPARRKQADIPFGCLGDFDARPRASRGLTQELDVELPEDGIDRRQDNVLNFSLRGQNSIEWIAMGSWKHTSYLGMA